MIHPRKVLSGAMLASVLALGLTGCGQSVEMTLSDGESLQWEELRGEWVFVNYWAEWCKPCYEEIPELNALDQHPGITVLGVNFDGETGESLRRVMRDMDIRFRVLEENPAEQFGWSQPLALPATMVINPDGDLVEARFGEQTEEELKQLTE
ncbi:MAG: TlpA family protein disulfide reductase [Oleiphilaceae bacterium]|nr:TlpA family protein disulfide reductase [Oleiphilaceae bacterium]